MMFQLPIGRWLRTLTAWLLAGLAIVALVLGMHQSQARRHQRDIAASVVRRASEKVKEVQHDQLEASMHVRGGRHNMVERLRRGGF